MKKNVLQACYYNCSNMLHMSHVCGFFGWSTCVCDGLDHKQTPFKVGPRVTVSQFMGAGDRQP